MSASAPMFESLGFFDFESPPSPPQEPRAQATGNAAADDDFDMEAELAMMQEEEAERCRRPMFDEPPPPMEEEEPDWDEDEAAMADAWANDVVGSSGIVTQTVTKTAGTASVNRTTVATKTTSIEQMTFGDSDIFDAPVASCEWAVGGQHQLMASFSASAERLPREHTESGTCSSMPSSRPFR